MADAIRVGDVVRVIAGKTSGRVGMVLSIKLTGAVVVGYQLDGTRSTASYRPEHLEILSSQPEKRER